MATITEPMALDKTFNTTETTPRSQADVLAAIESAIRQGFGQSAADVSYDNTTSELTADDVQEAIDELADEKVDKVAGKGLSSNDFTDEDKEALDNMELDIASTQTVSGNPITLTDCAPINAESLVVELEPKQEGSGDPSPTNIRPITGYTECEVDDVGKNLLPLKFYKGLSYNTSVGNTFDLEEYSDGSQSGNSVSFNITAWGKRCMLSDRLKAGNYKLSMSVTSTASDLNYTEYVLDADYKVLRKGSIQNSGTSRNVNSSVTISDGDCYIAIELGCNANATITYTEPQIEKSSTATSYEPYHSSNATIQFGQTVYGGRSNFTEGGTDDAMGLQDLGALTWTKDADDLYSCAVTLPVAGRGADGLCEAFTVVGETAYVNMPNNSLQILTTGIWVKTNAGYTDGTAFKTAMDGIKLVYDLANHTTISTPPTDLKLLKGTNNITTNGTTINLGYQPDNVVGELKGEIEKCAVDAEFMQFTDGTDTFTDVNLSLDAYVHTVSVVGSKIEQKRFICFEVMDKMGGALQGILASCIAFTDGAKTPSGTAFRAYIESLQMYVNFRIYGSGGSYTLAYQSETSFSTSAFFVRVRMMNNL